MGKKPLVAIVGLIWAGMALVGCENCKNCQNKFKAPPTYPMKVDTVQQPGLAPLPVATLPAVGAAGKAETAKTADIPTGTKGFSPETPTMGTPVSNPLANSPTTQTNLRPSDELRPTGGLPGQGADYRSGETPISRMGSAEGGGLRVPPCPVTSLGACSSAELPPLSVSSLPTKPFMPAPPVALAPLGGANSMPGIDQSGR